VHHPLHRPCLQLVCTRTHAFLIPFRRYQLHWRLWFALPLLWLSHCLVYGLFAGPTLTVSCPTDGHTGINAHCLGLYHHHRQLSQQQQRKANDAEWDVWSLDDALRCARRSRPRRQQLRVTACVYHIACDRKRELTTAYSNEISSYSAATPLSGAMLKTNRSFEFPLPWSVGHCRVDDRICR